VSVAAGMFWILLSLGFGLILVQYVAGGARLQLFDGPVSSGSVLMGSAQVAAFFTAMVICFAIGAGLCAHGLVSNRQD
jgi:hypothetical protein